MYRKEDLLVALSAIINFLGHAPAAKEMKDKKPSLSTYVKHFGSFEQALEQAQKVNIQKITKKSREDEDVEYKKELIKALQEKKVELGRVPKAKDFRPRGSEPSYRTFVRKFGSFNEALKRAGFSAKMSHKECETDQAREKIQQKAIELAKRIGRVPKRIEITQMYDQSEDFPRGETVLTIFGGYDKFLKEANIVTRNGKVNTVLLQDSMLKKLKILSILVGELPSSRMCNILAKEGVMFCARTYERRFGSWQEAVNKAMRVR